MDDSTTNSLQLIGLCLAPLEESRIPLLEESVERIRDWGKMLYLCEARYIAPLVLTRLREAGQGHRIPDEIRDRLQSLYLNIAALNAYHLHQILQINSTLGERGVEVLFLKGASLMIAGDYPDLGQRMFSDVDLLVDESHQEQVNQVFSETDDWKKLPSRDNLAWVDGGSAPDWRETTWVDSRGSLVEIHWHLFPLNGVPNAVAEQRLWRGARQVEYRARKVMIPSREDRFIQAAIHSTAHHSFDSNFLFTTIADLAHLAGDGKSKIDWDRMADQLRQEKMLEHVAVVVELASELTGHEPLIEGLARIHATAPGLSAITKPLAEALSKMVQKPWLFTSRTQTLLFAKIPLVRRARYLLPRIARSVFSRQNKPTNSPGPAAGAEEPGAAVYYKKKMLDLDSFNYNMELCKFYRRINYSGYG